MKLPKITFFDIYTLMSAIISITVMVLASKSKIANTDDIAYTGIYVILLVVCLAWLCITMQIRAFKKGI